MEENLRTMSAADRTRRYRERLRKGIGIAPTPYDNEIVAMLLDWDWLPLTESEDPNRIGEAIYRLLSDTAKNR